MAGSKFEYLTATRMRELLISRKASAVELLDVHIERVRNSIRYSTPWSRSTKTAHAGRLGPQTMPARAARIWASFMAYP